MPQPGATGKPVQTRSTGTTFSQTVDTSCPMPPLPACPVKRLGVKREGDSNIIGPCSVGWEVVREVDVPNRYFLMEFCAGRQLAVANTNMNCNDDSKVIYMEPVARPLGEITVSKFAFLDLLLVP